MFYFIKLKKKSINKNMQFRADQGVHKYSYSFPGSMHAKIYI